MTPERTHDERMLELMRDLSNADLRFEQTLSHLRWMTTARSMRGSRNDYRTPAEVLEAAEAKRDSGDLSPWDLRSIEESIGRYYVAFGKRLAARNALAEHERSYTGWQRYFLVTSSAGLIHRSMDCHTCNKGRRDTQFALLPEMSGLWPEVVVEAFGPALCSVCFTDAPVDWTDTLRLPNTVTSVLLESGPEAFHKAVAEWQERKAKRAAKAVQS